MLIDNEYGGHGTGFLIYRPSQERSKEAKCFLITNKHVLNPDPKLRDKATKIILHFNMKNENNSIVGQEAEFPTNFGTSKKFREHQSEDVDIIAFDVTQFLAEYPSIQKQMATYDMLLTSDKIADWDIKIGDEINVVGYPDGIRHETTNFPIIRSGIISSMMGENLDKPPDGKSRKRVLRGFLVDGGTVPGSSGSPVVLPPISFRNVHGRLQIQNYPLLLLGIIAESRYAHTADFLSFSGLGLAFYAEAIKEPSFMYYNRSCRACAAHLNQRTVKAGWLPISNLGSLSIISKGLMNSNTSKPFCSKHY
jgi:Trypsin-like peptidase domain